jgi:exoribonuclease-2
LNVFYEEEGNFKIGSVMVENPGSMQVEAAHGKRSKIKSSNVLLRFNDALTGFMEQAQAGADEIDADFLWQCCGESEFGFEDIAKEYYGHAPTSVEAAAVAIRLHSAPMYFYRKGKGRYKAAPEESLKAALASHERKRIQAEQMTLWVAEMQANRLPDAMAQKLEMLLYAPDKNALEWKALDEAANAVHLTHLKLLELCGAVPSAHDYHFNAFLREHFPGGIAFPPHEKLVVPELPQTEVAAFSIDDSTTTEIDDAFSVQALANGNMRVGIHIAAPSLGVLPGSELDAVAMQRLSTVYMPGCKITMLPEDTLAPYSLAAGAVRPALSLYLEVTPDYAIASHETRIENVRIADNLRHDELEPVFNENTLDRPGDHPYWPQLLLLFHLAEALEKGRGKYDPNRPPQMDYNFYVEHGRVTITERRRGSPMDKLVAELMIYANAHWGGLLAEKGIPGIYRAQMGGKVYMTVNAEPHQGLGVAQYAWSTSPLRRAVDMVNQRQIIALVQGVAPVYAKGSDALTTVMREFDVTYNAYGEFQQRMERYWCLQWLLQEGVKEINATVWRENLVRLEGLPYITRVPSLPELATGQRVTLKVERIDPLLMELTCKFVTKLDAVVEVPVTDTTPVLSPQ